MTIIKVIPHDPIWQKLFADESLLLKEALKDNFIAIHHIGSTSIPNLAAKPIIDIIPVVKNIAAVDKYNAAFETLGYEAKGEFGILFRRFFKKPGFHVHVFEVGSPEIERHIKFRDWMLKNPKDLNKYAKLKTNLAKKFPNNIYSYCLGKDDFIASIDAKSGYNNNNARIVIATTDYQLSSYHRIRKQQIFEPINIPYDQNHPTITAKNHFHIVMYSGTKIVSIAHIEFLNETEAALRSLATDEIYKNQGHGKTMMRLIEKWLISQGKNINLGKILTKTNHS